MKNVYSALVVAGILTSLSSCQKESVSSSERPAPVGSYITGNKLQGTLKCSLKQDSTYYLIGDMIVNPLDSFAVSPGAKIIAMGNYRIEIAGVLICDGTEATPITFTTKDDATAHTNLGQSGYWGGFLIDSTSPNVSVSFSHTNYTAGPDACGCPQAIFDVQSRQAN